MSDAGGAETEQWPAEQIEQLLAPNLEHAALCVNSALSVVAELGAATREHLAALEVAVEHALHFLQLSKGHIAHLQRLELQRLELSQMELSQRTSANSADRAAALEADHQPGAGTSYSNYGKQ